MFTIINMGESETNEMALQVLKRQIKEISDSMPPQPDAGGKIILSFLQWVDSLGPDLTNVLLGNTKALKILKKVYSIGIYNLSEPAENPFDFVLNELLKKQKETEEKNADFKSGRIEIASKINETTIMGSDGEIYSEEIFQRILKNLEEEIGFIRTVSTHV